MVRSIFPEEFGRNFRIQMLKDVFRKNIAYGDSSMGMTYML